MSQNIYLDFSKDFWSCNWFCQLYDDWLDTFYQRKLYSILLKRYCSNVIVNLKTHTKNWYIKASCLLIYLLISTGLILVHRRVTPSTHLNTLVKRGTVRVKCLAQEHNWRFPWRGLKPSLLDRETSALKATRPPRFHHLVPRRLKSNFVATISL